MGMSIAERKIALVSVSNNLSNSILSLQNSKNALAFVGFVSLEIRLNDTIEITKGMYNEVNKRLTELNKE